MGSLPLAVLVCVLAFAACGGSTEIILSADRDTISAGGTDFAAITARALLAGEPVRAGTTVYFDTSGGSFTPVTAAGNEMTSTEVATNTIGAATVKLYSGLGQGTATVTASFTDDESGLYASSSITITFGPPSGGKLPVDGAFRMTCDAVNIGALRVPMPDIKVTCDLTAQTRGGEAIPATALSPVFLTEAGGFTVVDDVYTGKRVFVYSHKSGSSAPQDVAPDPTLGEPSYFDGNGRERNPRDGLVTLVAVVDGEEAFTDLNGNGRYDPGEPFVDAAEPFVDLDDNDKWDPGEPFHDTDGNGKWDPANGKWDASTKIMAVYKILWTGALDSSSKTSRLERASSTIPDGGKLTVAASVLDANMNPIAAFPGNQDYLYWTLSSGSSDAISNSPTDVSLQNALGFSFDIAASTERKRWTIVPNSFTPPTYSFTVEDGYPQDGDDAPLPFTLSATAYSSPGPDGAGSWLSQLTEQIIDEVQGTCD